MNTQIKLKEGVIITGATLLTTEEAEQLSEETRALNCWWWLRSKGRKHRNVVAGVWPDGSIDYDGNSVDDDNAYVRPALILSMKSAKLKTGDVIHFGGKDFKVISNTCALCTGSIGKCVFRDDWSRANASNYEASDVKKFVDDWYESVLRYTVEEVTNAINDIPFSSFCNCGSVKEIAELVADMLNSTRFKEEFYE